ncbi:MAG: hypothetical protein ABIJ09_04800 [Pseudomonadota bacterium]
MTPRLWLALCVLGAGVAGGCSCTYENSVDVPGDVHRFDPIAALPAVLAYAGPGAQLLGLDVLHAREDGTLDLEADYYPGWTVPVRYQVLRPSTQTVDPSIPLGARPALEPLESVEIEVMKPHWRTVDTNGSEWTSKHRGMLGGTRRGVASSRPATGSGSGAVASAPGCDLGTLWQVARQRGAPSGAVATIHYDAAGYRFAIPQTSVDFQVDASCR